MVKIETDPRVIKVFKRYPKFVQAQMNRLRELILEVAAEQEDISEIEETLKWGEPSYLVKKGSTIRIDWKEKSPEQYAVYFKCTSRLVPTFKAVYGDKFRYENNRAIVFRLKERIPKKALQSCIAAALQYHKVKQLPLLGM